MRQKRRVVLPVSHGLLAVENGGGILHSPVSGSRLDICKLLVGVGAELLLKVSKNRRRLTEVLEPRAAILGIHPALYGNPIDRTHGVNRKVRHPYDHHLGRKRHVRPPQGGADVAGRRVAHESPVAHHLVLLRCSNPKFDRRLVGQVVDDGQPVTRPVGPVVPEKSAVTVPVRTDDQPIRGNASIFDLKGMRLPRGEGLRSNAENVVGVRIRNGAPSL